MKECVNCGAVTDGDEIACSYCGNGRFRQRLRRFFISHAWDQSKAYYELVALLDAAYPSEWTNLSIPADKAVEVATEPTIRSQQLKALISQKVTILTDCMDARRRQRQETIKSGWVEREFVVEDYEWGRMNIERDALRRQLADIDREAEVRNADLGIKLERIYRRQNRPTIWDTPKERTIRDNPYLALSIHHQVTICRLCFCYSDGWLSIQVLDRV
jgi:hypothetical protein